MLDLFITNTQLFASQYIDGVMWINLVDCDVFISCLDSFWRHPFTAEDPLVSKWCNAKFLQICYDEETNLSTSWMAWGHSFLSELLIYTRIKSILWCILVPGMIVEKHCYYQYLK